jgi:hypothetical protein
MTSSTVTNKVRVPRDVSGWWFAIPLRRGGYVAALTARNKPSTMMLVYPLDRHFQEIPQLHELTSLVACDCLPARVITCDHVRRGLWPLIHKHPDFSREAWPIPMYFRVPGIGPAFMTKRAEDNLAYWDYEVRYMPGSDPREAEYPERLIGDRNLHDYFNDKFNPY